MIFCNLIYDAITSNPNPVLVHVADCFLISSWSPFPQLHTCSACMLVLWESSCILLPGKEPPVAKTHFLLAVSQRMCPPQFIYDIMETLLHLPGTQPSCMLSQPLEILYHFQSTAVPTSAIAREWYWQIKIMHTAIRLLCISLHTIEHGEKTFMAGSILYSMEESEFFSTLIENSWRFGYCNVAFIRVYTMTFSVQPLWACTHHSCDLLAPSSLLHTQKYLCCLHKTPRLLLNNKLRWAGGGGGGGGGMVKGCHASWFRNKFKCTSDKLYLTSDHCSSAPNEAVQKISGTFNYTPIENTLLSQVPQTWNVHSGFAVQ